VQNAWLRPHQENTIIEMGDISNRITEDSSQVGEVNSIGSYRTAKLITINTQVCFMELIMADQDFSRRKEMLSTFRNFLW